MKVISCRISDEVFYKVQYELKNLNMNSSDFIRMLLNNYFIGRLHYVKGHIEQDTIEDIEIYVDTLRRFENKDLKK
jgi:hypothetical protein